MITQTMVQPSFWIEVGIQIQKVRGLNLFKFNDDLQARLEVLIDSLSETLRERQKANILTAEETTERLESLNSIESSH
jgi:hypothetical protein